MYVQYALTCVTADLPALRKTCGFLSHAASMGCSKCMNKLKSGAFGEKRNVRNHQSHIEYISEINSAKTLTERKKLVKTWGVRYSGTPLNDHP